MGSAENKELEKDLEALRQALPDPFQLQSRLDEFFTHPAAQKLMSEPALSAERLVTFLKSTPEPSLARIAVMVLSRVPPALFYREILEVLASTDREMTQAFEPGLWMIQMDEEQIAKDLVDIVKSSGNPNPLALLQRPAARAVRSDLAQMIMQGKQPLGLYALYSYRDAVAPDDIELLKDIANRAGNSEMRALAAGYLLNLGSSAGKGGIQAGLSAEDVQVREMTYRDLADHLPSDAIKAAGYDTRAAPASQQAAIAMLLDALAQAKAAKSSQGRRESGSAP